MPHATFIHIYSSGDARSTYTNNVYDMFRTCTFIEFAVFRHNTLLLSNSTTNISVNVCIRCLCDAGRMLKDVLKMCVGVNLSSYDNNVELSGHILVVINALYHLGTYMYMYYTFMCVCVWCRRIIRAISCELWLWSKRTIKQPLGTVFTGSSGLCWLCCLISCPETRSTLEDHKLRYPFRPLNPTRRIRILCIRHFVRFTTITHTERELLVLDGNRI